ncbi:13512_t:CDS:1 [Acaulospora morrowiae]|uniref:13512_t:CDS:1 n=1 Tax=Acaulospora morrowiae TaxID=94023 RepID=A0A9N8ZAY9_9GLOM|nr:13512_t:CDS:1 [Acaulospora morrowiae]
MTDDERSSTTSSNNYARDNYNVGGVPVPIQYTRRHQNLFFAYAHGSNKFQRGELGLSNSYLEGCLVFNYDKAVKIKSVILHFKGIEKVEGNGPGNRGGTRTFSNVHVLAERHKKLDVKLLERTASGELPFHFPLHSNLSSSFGMKVERPKNDNVVADFAKAQINYTLSATVETEKRFINTTDLVEVNCPLKQILAFYDIIPFTKVTGTHCSPSNRPLLKYSFDIPEYLGIGTETAIPIRIKLIKSNVKILRIDATLRTCVELSLENQEKMPKQCVKDKHNIGSEVFNSHTAENEDEILQMLPLFIPNNIHATYFGTFVIIKHKLDIKLRLEGRDLDLRKTVPITIATIRNQDRMNTLTTPQSDVISYQDFRSERSALRHDGSNSSDSVNEKRSNTPDENNEQTQHPGYTYEGKRRNSEVSQVSSKPGVTEIKQQQFS